MSSGSQMSQCYPTMLSWVFVVHTHFHSQRLEAHFLPTVLVWKYYTYFSTALMLYYINITPPPHNTSPVLQMVSPGGDFQQGSEKSNTTQQKHLFNVGDCMNMGFLLITCICKFYWWSLLMSAESFTHCTDLSLTSVLLYVPVWKEFVREVEIHDFICLK